ncbi:MAG: hypothetical protein PHW03_03030 [Eubacteriales bacterium]|nr:hypothetical protein [Eubacteriales bacterium]MDD4389759.1 hypothetical protein [Eubacteriales bacterium]
MGFRKTKSKRNLILALMLALLLILGMVGCGENGNEQGKDSGDAQPVEQQKSPELIISLYDFNKLHMTDYDRAMEQYGGKYIEFTGYIISIDHEDSTFNVSFLENEEQYSSYNRYKCLPSVDLTDKLKKVDLLGNKEIAIRGYIGTGKMADGSKFVIKDVDYIKYKKGKAVKYNFAEGENENSVGHMLHVFTNNPLGAQDQFVGEKVDMTGYFGLSNGRVKLFDGNSGIKSTSMPFTFITGYDQATFIDKSMVQYKAKATGTVDYVTMHGYMINTETIEQII